MQNLPDGEEAADFSEVLKIFYKAVYEGQDEKPPPILKIFEREKVPDKIKANGELKSKSHHLLKNENVPNGHANEHEVNGTCKEFSVGVNGFPNKDDMDINSRFPHRDSLELRNKAGVDLKSLQFSNAVNPVLIFSSDELKECAEEDSNDDDNDSGIQNGMPEGMHTLFTVTCTSLSVTDV